MTSTLRRLVSRNFCRSHCRQQDGRFSDSASKSDKKDFENPDYEYDNELITGHGLKRVYRLKAPIKPYHDSKMYDSVFLPNNMKILLISDQREYKDVRAKYDYKQKTLHCIKSNYDRTESLAGCSLTIGVGYFSDPPEIPGLAHLLQRIILRGCKKHPKDFSGFEAFIKSRGGFYTGSTGCENTTFTFGCKLEDLCAAMERFSQYFIEPLMAWFVMDDERKKIDNELSNFDPTDSMRMEQIICSLATPNNPAYKNKWGNFGKISKSVSDKQFCDAVNNFRSKYYSANLMTLVLQGDLPLKVLRMIAVDNFAEVPNNITLGRMYEADVAFDPEKFNKVYLMKSKELGCVLTVNWAVPPSLPMYRMNALEYIACLIRREGRGSLIKYLRKKSWANSITAGLIAGEYSKNTVYSMFRVSLKLHEEKKCFITDILAALFSYMNMFRLEKPCENLFKELFLIRRTNFAISDDKPVLENVKFLSTRMQYFDSVDYISGDEMFYEFWPNLISQYMELLKPTSANFLFSSHHWWKQLDKIEPNLKTEYTTDTFSTDVKYEWENLDPLEEFHFPLRNEFISFNFKVHPVENPESNDMPHPRLIKSTKLCEIWHKQDTKYKKPVTLLNLQISSPRVLESIENAVLLDLYTDVLNYFLVPELAPAREALVNCEVKRTKTGISVSVRGLSEKIPSVLSHISDYINQLPTIVSQALLTNTKHNLLKEYYRSNLNLKKITYELRNALLLNSYWMSSDKYLFLSSVSMEKFQEFTKYFYDGVFVQCLAQGNVTSQSTVTLVEAFLTSIRCSEIMGYMKEIAEAEIPYGEKCCLIKSPHLLNPSHFILNCYHIGIRSPKSTSISKLIISLLNTTPYVKLSRKYFTNPLFYHRLTNYSMLNFLVGAQVSYDPKKDLSIDVNNHKMTNFLQEALIKIRNFSKSDFEHYISDFISQKKFMSENLGEEFQKNWNEVVEGTYQFNFSKFEVQVLETICVKDLVNFLEPQVNPGHLQHKVLSIQAYGKNEKDMKLTTMFILPERIELEIVREKTGKPTHYFIQSVEEYKKQLKYHVCDYNKEKV